MLWLSISFAQALLDLDGVADPLSRLEGAELLDLDTLRSRPEVQRGVQARWCQGAPTTMKQVDQALQAAEGASLTMEDAQAARLLEVADRALACLGEPVVASVAARVAYARGLLAYRGGFEALAADSFVLARALDPDLAWDEAQSPKARPLWEASHAPPELVVQILPAQAMVNGRPHDGSLPVGRHLLQVEGRSGWLEVFGPGRLLLPWTLGADDLAPFDAQAQALLFDLTVGETVWVLAEGQLWEPVGGGWSIAAPREREVWAPAVGGAGLGVAAVGVGLWLGGASGVGDATSRAGSAETWEDYHRAAQDAENSAAMGRAGQVLTVSGLAVAGAATFTMTRSF